MSGPNELLRVVLEDGKYIIVQDAQGLRALRYGEAWRDCIGDNLIGAMAHEIEDLRKKLHNAERLYEIAIKQGVQLATSVGMSMDTTAYERGIEDAAAQVDCGCPYRTVVLAECETAGVRKAQQLCAHGVACCALQAHELRQALKKEPANAH